MGRALGWSAGVAVLSIVAAVMARFMPTPWVGAVLAGLTAPGIVIAAHEILRATDGPVDAKTRRSALLAVAVLVIPVVVLLTFTQVDWGSR
jgi:hypothetical protein